jgi:hypothetical protein
MSASRAAPPLEDAASMRGVAEIIKLPQLRKTSPLSSMEIPAKIEIARRDQNTRYRNGI